MIDKSYDQAAIAASAFIYHVWWEAEAGWRNLRLHNVPASDAIWRNMTASDGSDANDGILSKHSACCVHGEIINYCMSEEHAWSIHVVCVVGGM